MRCSDCGGYKCNPDENLRRLEQAASSGDIYAARKLSLEKHRRRLCGDGEDCWQCQVNKIHNHNWGVRYWAAVALGEIGDPVAIPTLVEVIQNDSNSTVQKKAAWALGKIGNPAAIPALVETMQNGYFNDVVRWVAAEALGNIGDPSAIPALVETMQEDAESYLYWCASGALKKLRAIKRNPGDENLRKLERTASSGDIHAARKLSLEKHRRRLCVDGKDCWQCQVNKIQNGSNWEIRQRAALELIEIGDPAAIPTLVEIMQNYSDSYIRLLAARGLGSIGGPVAISALAKAMKNYSDSGARWEAPWALGNTKDPTAIPALVETIQNDPDPDMRRGAIWALGRINDPAAIPYLVETLKNDSNPEVRGRAATALGDIGDPVVIPDLIETMLNDPDVREEAAEALEGFRTPEYID